MRKHPLANCEECPLLENRFCPSVGPEKAKIVLVGEAPGGEEVKQGEPFVGASGQLLNALLREIGVKREDVFITNTVLCRPDGNANPTAGAIAACSERLQYEIQSRDPEVMVPMGNFAARKILGTNEGITTLRVGPPKKTDRFPGVSIIPTFHPAATLYNANAFPDLETDFRKIVQPKVETGWEPPEFDVIVNRDEAYTVLSEIDRQFGVYCPIALDIEVGVDKDISEVHPFHYQWLCVGIAAEENSVFVFSEEVVNNQGFMEYFGSWLARHRLICHNGKFDLQGLYKWHPEIKLWFDTMLASYSLDERRGVHSLEYNAVEKLGSPIWKHEIGHYLGEDKNYAVIPRPVLYRYNAYDVANTFRLFRWFERAIPDGTQLRMLHDHLVEASNMLMHVERNGIAVDLEYLDQLSGELEEELDRYREILQEFAGDGSYNPNSWQQVKEVLKKKFRLHVRDTQWERTLKPAMEAAARRGQQELYEFLEAHGNFKSTSKLYGTYAKGTRIRLIGGRVYSTFMLHGTTTGRLASRNPNLQNVPRGPRVRRLFVPGSDSQILGQADYRQAELRVVCTLARDPYLRSLFARGVNIFEQIGSRIYGEGFTKAQKEEYFRMKAIVHGANYGREAFSIAAEFRMSEAEAQKLIDDYFALIPNVVAWRKSIEKEVKEGELISPFGNRRRYPLITRTNLPIILKEAYAFYPQNIVSNLLLRSGIRLAEQGMRDMLRIPVHDAWVFECDKDQTEDIGRLVSSTMEEVVEEFFTDYVPFPVDIDFAASWGEIA